MDFILETICDTKKVTGAMYKNTELLLEIYKKVKFHVKNSMAEIDEELYILERKRLTDMLHELVDYDITPEKQKIQERLASNDFSLCLLEIMEDALLILKDYPDNGDLFYRLLRYRYFEAFKNTNEDVMTLLDDMPYTTYYRKRKKAIQLYALILWGLTKKREVAPEYGELPFL